MHEILVTNCNIACNLYMYWLILNMDEIQIELYEHHQAKLLYSLATGNIFQMHCKLIKSTHLRYLLSSIVKEAG